MVELKNKLEKAKDLSEKKNYKDAIALYFEIVNDENANAMDQLKLREQAVFDIADIYVKQKDATALRELLAKIAPFLKVAAKAKTAKVVRKIIDKSAELVENKAQHLELIKESVEWAKKEKRSYLRQRLEARLGSSYVDNGKYAEALAIAAPLCIELKKMDDKLLLVETRLFEAKSYLMLRNIAKAKASLTAARTNANAVYTPPLLQAQMDTLAGMLHSEEKDYKTGFSYFYEAFENYHQLERSEAFTALNYMLLSKIMMNKPEEVASVLTSKLALKYAGDQVNSLRAIAEACKARSLHKFEEAKKNFPQAIKDDPVITTHLEALYGDLLEAHLSRIIEPYSCIELKRVAELMELSVQSVEKRLSHMILEKKINGILDQGDGCLIIYEEPQSEKLYQTGLETMTQMSGVVDVLFQQANTLL